MKNEIVARELQRVKELVTEYQNKGFQVVLPSSRNDVPEFLRSTNYTPDLIARSPSENLVVEVKSRRTSSDLARLSQIAEQVNAQDGWQFVLVFTNPRDPSATVSQPSAEKANALLIKSRALGVRDQTHIEAAFLFAWAAVEAALQLLPQAQKSSRNPATPWTLVRNAAMYGHIGRKDAKALERAFKRRNALLHAGDADPPTLADVELLRRVAQELIQVGAENEV